MGGCRPCPLQGCPARGTRSFRRGEPRGDLRPGAPEVPAARAAAGPPRSPPSCPRPPRAALKPEREGAGGAAAGVAGPRRHWRGPGDGWRGRGARGGGAPGARDRGGPSRPARCSRRRSEAARSPRCDRFSASSPLNSSSRERLVLTGRAGWMGMGRGAARPALGFWPTLAVLLCSFPAGKAPARERGRPPGPPRRPGPGR